MIFNVVTCKILPMLLVCYMSLALCGKKLLEYWSAIEDLFFSAQFLACKG